MFDQLWGFQKKKKDGGMGVRGRGFSCVVKPDSQAKAQLPPAWHAALPCGEPVCSLDLIRVRYHGRCCRGRHLITPHHKNSMPAVQRRCGRCLATAAPAGRTPVCLSRAFGEDLSEEDLGTIHFSRGGRKPFLFYKTSFNGCLR